MDEEEVEEFQETVHPVQRVGLVLLLVASVAVFVIAAIR